MVTHTFNPSTRKVETGRDMAGKRERNVRQEKTGAQDIQSEILETGYPIWSKDFVDVRTSG